MGSKNNNPMPVPVNKENKNKKNNMPVTMKKNKSSDGNDVWEISEAKKSVPLKQKTQHINIEEGRPKNIYKNMATKDSFNFNVVTSILTIILAVISVVVIIMWLWSFVFNARPTTNFTAQVSTIGPTDKEYFMEFNQLRGKNGNGEIMNEVKLTFYTSHELTTKFKSGIQSIGKIKTSWINPDTTLFTDKAYYQRKFDSEKYYYNEDSNNHSYIATDELNNDDFFVIKISDKIYKITFSDKKIRTGQFLWIQQFEISNEVSLFEGLVQSVNSLQAGDYVINFPLSQYFDISEFNKKTTQFDKLNIETQNKIFVETKVHIEDRGAVNHVQSIFNNIKCDPNYNADGIEDKPYWKTTPTMELISKDFEIKEGYISLNKNLINYCNYNTNLEVYINLDLSKFTEQIKGFDYYGLYGIKLSKIKIIAPKQQKFEIRSLALKDTGITAAAIITNNVNIVEVA